MCLTFVWQQPRLKLRKLHSIALIQSSSCALVRLFFLKILQGMRNPGNKNVDRASVNYMCLSSKNTRDSQCETVSPFLYFNMHKFFSKQSAFHLSPCPCLFFRSPRFAFHFLHCPPCALRSLLLALFSADKIILSVWNQI